MLPQPSRLPRSDFESNQPGRVFDELSDPFEDDSADSMATRKKSILQATFARDDANPAHSNAATPKPNDVYADYYSE